MKDTCLADFLPNKSRKGKKTLKKAIIAMSGGVDSSVAAQLTIEKGYECIGVTMKLFCGNEDSTCCSEKDVEDAKEVSNRLNMEHFVVNFTDDFDEKVIKKFINAYETGATPNPCIECNRYLKFEKLMEKMYELSYDFVVTGHYARIEKNGDRYLLKKALDETKDQSYVLYSLSQEQLSHTLFPLGELKKEDARKIAEENGFINAKKKDSQDICFVPDGDYAKFIEDYSGKKYPDGDFVDQNGNVLGRHKGIIRYTVGQRKGLGLSLPAPMYVMEKDTEKNQVVLCSNEELFSDSLEAENFNWIAYEAPPAKLNVKAKIRYNQKEEDAVVTPLDNGRVLVEFLKPQRAVAKGQAVVLYDGDMVVGGGTIC